MRTALALGLSLAAPAHAADGAQRYALLVGANDGGRGRIMLRYAHDDVLDMGQVLTGIGGIAPGDRSVLLDPNVATLVASLEQLRERVRTTEGRAEVIFYYSGHSDEDGLLLGEGRFDYPDLRDALAGLGADVHLAILDSCASGSMIRGKGGRAVPSFLQAGTSTVEGFAYITSSAADEVAQEAERIGGSYFTHFLSTGLRGAADQSEDGRVTLSEAYTFAYDATLARTSRTQHGPQHANYDFQLFGAGDLVLTDLTLTDASMLLDAAIVGQVQVRTASGDLVAESRMLGGRAMELGLGRGTYELLITAEGRYAVAHIDLVPGTTALVGLDDLRWFEGEAAVPRGTRAPPPANLEPAFRPAPTHRIRAGVAALDTPSGTDMLLFGLPAVAAQELDGLSLAFGLSRVEGRAAGAQLALGANTTRELDGVQAALGFNLVNGDSARGLQLALGLNAARRGMTGVQGAIGVNFGARVYGAQLGTINVARSVNGLQFGLVNVSKQVHGVQIGLINIAENVDGTSIGLLSLERDGRHHLLLYSSLTDMFNMEIKLGGQHTHTILGGGVSLRRHAWGGVGYGVHVTFGPHIWLDTDILARSYIATAAQEQLVDGNPHLFEGPFKDLPTMVATGRLTLGVQAFPRLALFGGATLNYRADLGSPQLDIAPVERSRATERDLWAGVFAGVQF